MHSKGTPLKARVSPVDSFPRTPGCAGTCPASPAVASPGSLPTPGPRLPAFSAPGGLPAGPGPGGSPSSPTVPRALLPASPSTLPWGLPLLWQSPGRGGLQGSSSSSLGCVQCSTPLACAGPRLPHFASSPPSGLPLPPSHASTPMSQAPGGQRALFPPTPSKIISISTPVRPCSRQKAKEMQDDINTAIEDHSVPCLKAALQRRHGCPAEHSLHESVRQAHLPALRMLLHSRAEPNAQCFCFERGCEYPLQLASSCANFLRSSDRAQAVEMLLQFGAKPDAQRSDAEKNTPLHDAIQRNDFEVAFKLLRYSANANRRNGFGETPLHLLLRTEGSARLDATLLSMAEKLLRAGASPLLPDAQGMLPSACAAEPRMRALLARWAAWWRCRTLAWVRSRSQSPLSQLMPDLLLCVGKFL